MVTGDIDLSTVAQKVVGDAVQEARALQQDRVVAEHVLLALVNESACTGGGLLEALEVNPSQVRDQTLEMLKFKRERSMQDFYSQGKDLPWRIEAGIVAARQEYLAGQLAAATSTSTYLDGDANDLPERLEVYPFKNVKLSRADLEWLLLTHEEGNGPVDWSDESQRTRKGLDLRGADLRGADLRRLPLAGMRGGQEWEASAGAHLEGANLSEAHLEGANLFWAHLEGADLSAAYLNEANLAAVHLNGANLVGAHLEGANLGDAHMEQADLTTAHLEVANLCWAHLEGARLEGTHLEEANLKQTSLK